MTAPLLRRAAIVLAALALAASAPHAQGRSAAAAPQLRVYKSPTCGCCANWIQYMQANGFTASATDMVDLTPIKKQHGVPPRLTSCHTSLVGGYVIEGHVP